MHILLNPDFVSVFQCGNMAREGLRVLVVSKKSLTEEQYQDFEVRTLKASVCLQRTDSVRTCQMDILCRHFQYF